MTEQSLDVICKGFYRDAVHECTIYNIRHEEEVTNQLVIGTIGPSPEVEWEH